MNAHPKLKCAIVILYVMVFLVYGQTNNLSDAQVIEKAAALLGEREFPNLEMLSINKRMEAQWHPQHGASIWINSRKNDSIDVIVSLAFLAPPDYESYGKGKSNSHVTEKFIAQINKKFSNNIPLTNFIRKDLIVILEYADGDNVIFDGYYTDIRKNLYWWRRELDPTTNPRERFYRR